MADGGAAQHHAHGRGEGRQRRHSATTRTSEGDNRALVAALDEARVECERAKEGGDTTRTKGRPEGKNRDGGRKAGPNATPPRQYDAARDEKSTHRRESDRRALTLPPDPSIRTLLDFLVTLKQLCDTKCRLSVSWSANAVSERGSGTDDARSHPHSPPSSPRSTPASSPRPSPPAAAPRPPPLPTARKRPARSAPARRARAERARTDPPP